MVDFGEWERTEAHREDCLLTPCFLSPTGSVLWWLCRTWRRTWQRREVRSQWVLSLSLPSRPSVSLSASQCWLISISFKIPRTQLNPKLSRTHFTIRAHTSSHHTWEIFSFLFDLLLGVWCNKHNKRTARPHSSFCEGERIQGKIGWIKSFLLFPLGPRWKPNFHS